MATIKAFIRTTKKNKLTKVRLRISDGRGNDLYGVSPIEVLPEHWDSKKEEIKNRVLLIGSESREDVNTKISSLKNTVLSAYKAVPDKSTIQKDWVDLFLKVVQTPQPPQIKEPTKTLSNYFEEYRADVKVSEGRSNTTAVFGRILARYEVIYGIVTYEDCNTDFVKSIERFMRDETVMQTLYPNVYCDLAKREKIKPRGQNTLNDKLKILGAFFTWSRKKKYFKELPFEDYEYSSYVYADPIPLLPEEVEHLYKLKVPKDLELTRDLYCLQCYTGPRVGDYVNLREDNVQDGILMYIPEKTIEDTPVTVYVPLVDHALAIIEKYGYPDGKLMPFINVNGKDGYNKRIKKLCTFAKLTRSVMTINPITRKPEAKQLCDVVSSHTARKTFVNSNYIETQDPALISAMTGHSKGSRAFERYRNIGIDTLRKQVAKAFEKK